MALVFQILLAVVLLVGLITTIMTVKTLHWAQMLLLLAIFFSSLGTLVLGTEVFRVHRNLRKGIPALEQQIADVEAENEALRRGGDAQMAARIFAGETPFDVDAEGGLMPGEGVWLKRLQDLVRQRGRVWRGVTPSGAVDPATNRVPVQIAQPSPHGLEANSIVHAFEEGEPNAADPAEGAQYLGAFRVVESTADGAVLEAATKLDNRTGNRLVGSQRPWSLYEAMPADRHELFAGLTEEQLSSMLPAATVEEYIRHGQVAPKPEPTAPYDPLIAMFDEEEHRLGPADAAKAVKWLYDRRLRDYAYLFSAVNRELVELLAEKAGLTEDIKKLQAANVVAMKLNSLRTEEQQGLTGDLAHMEGDRDSARALLAAVQRQLEAARKLVTEALAENSRMARQLANEQLERLDRLERQAPTPGPQFLNAR